MAAVAPARTGRLDSSPHRSNTSSQLPAIHRIFLYHSGGDAGVPFAHLGLYAAILPQATVRVSEDRGHHFGNDLADVADDIARGETPTGREHRHPDDPATILE